MTDHDETGSKGIQSVEIAMSVLEALAASGGPVALGEIARRAEEQPSKIHRYLVSLVRIGLASQSPSSGFYDLGPALRRLGAAALQRSNAVAMASESAAVLRDDTGHAVNLSVWNDAGPIIVRWDYGAHALPLNVRVGATLPLLGSSAGRTFLACLPARLTQDALVANKKQLRAMGMTEDELRASLVQVRRASVSFMQDAVIPGISSLSSPIFSASDDLPIVMTLIFPREVSEHEIAQMRAKLKKTTEAVSRELGVEGAKEMR